MYTLFSREISYFSGKVRAALKYKQNTGAMPERFEDILATTEIVQKYLLPRTGSTLLPQLRCPDGSWLLDSSEILDYLDDTYPGSPITPPPSRPCQMLIALLLEFFGDEWLINYGFWARWYYARDDQSPNHAAFNAQQWSVVFRPFYRPLRRRAMADGLFHKVLGITRPDEIGRGPFAGLRDMGVNARTQGAFRASYLRFLTAFEAHLDHHDFTLGGVPTAGDFGLLAPLYAHIYRDAVPGFELRRDFPLVTEWVERTYASNDLNARGYAQKLYTVDKRGNLVPNVATSDKGRLLDGDGIPETLMPLLDMIFDEFWPVLSASIDRLAAYYRDHDVQPGSALPHKSFMASPGFEAEQRGDGSLTVPFTIGGIGARRMLVPNHIWMLQRLSDRIQQGIRAGHGPAFAHLLRRWDRGAELLDLERRLSACGVDRVNGMLVVRANSA